MSTPTPEDAAAHDVYAKHGTSMDHQPPTPEASGETLSDAQIEGLATRAQQHAVFAKDTVWPELAAALRELQQRRAASLPAAQGGDVAALVAAVERHEFACEGGPLSLCQPWIDLKAALDARLSPPQAGCQCAVPVMDGIECICQNGRGGQAEKAVDARLSPPQAGETCDIATCECGRCHCGWRCPQHPDRNPISVCPACVGADEPFPDVVEGAPEASVDLELIAAEAADAIDAAIRPFLGSVENCALPELTPLVLAALQRARETGR